MIQRITRRLPAVELNGEIQSEEIVDQVLLEEPQDQGILIGAQPPSVIGASRGTSRTAGTNGSAGEWINMRGQGGCCDCICSLLLLSAEWPVFFSI